MRSVTCFLWAIVLFGLFLRIHGLEAESLWFDETYTIGAVHKKNAAEIVHTLETIDVSPPLYYVFLGYWTGIFGTSAAAVRLPSVIFGVLALFVMYKIGKRLFDEQTGLLGATLLSLSIFHIYYSQEARMYSLMMLLALASFYFYIKMLDKYAELDAFFYVTSTILLIYTHVYGFFVVLAQNIHFFTSNRRFWKKWVQLQCFAALFFLPWIPSIFSQIANKQLSWIPPSNASNLLSSFVKYAQMDFAIYLLIPLALLLLWKNTFRKTYLLLLWFLTPIIIPIAISQAIPIFSFIFIIGALPAFYLLAASGIIHVKSQLAKTGIIILIIAFSAISAYSYNTTVLKEQWREASADIDAAARPDDVLLFNPGSQGTYSFSYYSNRTDLIKKSFPSEVTQLVNEENLHELQPLVESYKRVWFITSLNKDPDNLGVKTLEKRYNLTMHKEYTKIDVYLFEK